MSLNENEWKFEKDKPYVFISYKRENQSDVEEVIKELYRQYGLNIWYDANLTAGVNWDKEAKHHIRNVRCMAILFFASELALTSEPVKKELDTAKRYDRRIIPIAFKNKSFNDLLKEDINGYFDDEKIDIAEDIISEHLDSRLTYIVYKDERYIQKIIDAIKNNTNYPHESLVKRDLLNDSAVSAEASVSSVPVSENKPEEPKPVPVEERKIEKSADVRSVVSDNADCIYKLAERNGKYCAVVEVVGDNYKLLRGSRIAANDAPSTPKGAVKLRAEKSVPYGSYRLVEDVIEGSPSAVACVITGNSTNGRTFFDSAKVIDRTAVDNYLEAVGEVSYKREVPAENASVQNTEASGRGYTSTGDITYTLYGETYTSNQSDMMLNVFEKVMERHPGIVAALINADGMNCLSGTDYSKAENKASKPYFRTCKYFNIGGGVCVGTSYGYKDKLIKIAKLFAYCGESKDILRSDDIELPDVRAEALQGSTAVSPEVHTMDDDTANIVANLLCCYISKYNDDAYVKLKCNSCNKAFEKIAELTSKTVNNIKNLRDSYDPFFDNGRNGWWQKKETFYYHHSDLIEKMKNFRSIIQATEFVENELRKLGCTSAFSD